MTAEENGRPSFTGSADHVADAIDARVQTRRSELVQQPAARPQVGFRVRRADDPERVVLCRADLAELAEVAGGAAAIYLLSPVLLGVLGGVLRGYAGSTRPVEAYDLVTSGKCVIVDIRADTGRGEIKVPRGKVLSIPREKLSGSFAGDVEANLTALKVASLKGVKKGTKVLILDANGGGDATKVAKALASQGFGKTFVVQGGFNGWANAGLAIDR